MSDTPTTILVADDHPMFRSAVVHALRVSIQGCRVLEASSQSTLEASLGTTPDIDLYWRVACGSSPRAPNAANKTPHSPHALRN